MKRKKTIRVATAAMFLLSAATVSAGVTATIPATPDEQAAYLQLERIMHFRQADARLKMKQFLSEYPSSEYRDAVTLMLADSYFYDRQFGMAYQYYVKIRDDAFSGDVRSGFFYRKAFCLLKRGFYQEASWYFRSISGSPLYGTDAEFYLAYIDYVNGDYDKAYSGFRKIKTGPKSTEAEYYINQIDFTRGEYSKVAAVSDRLLSGDIPPELKAQTMRVGGLSYFKLGEMARAKQLLSQYIDLTGDGAEVAAVYALGSIYYDEKDYDRALPLFTSITSDQENKGAIAQSSWLYIGQIYVAKNEPQSAALAFNKATEESWNHDVSEAASYNLAVASAMGNSLPFADTVTQMENFIREYPHSPYVTSLSRYLANAYYTRRDYTAALRQIDRITPQDSYTRSARQKILYQMGVDDFRNGKLSEAVKSLTEASASSAPEKEVAAQAALWLGDAYFNLKKYSEAAKAYESAINSGLLGDNTALGYYNLGYADLKLSNYTKAENAFKKAIDTKGLSVQQTADARLRYADCLYYNRNYSQALTLYRSIKMEGGDNVALVSLREAEILGRQGKVNEKISILEGLLETATDSPVYDTIVTTLAEAYSEQGNDRKAATLYSKIIDNGTSGGNDDAYYSLAANAENLYNNGDMEGALEAYRRLAKSDIPALGRAAAIGIMRTSTIDDEIIEYAAKVEAIPGIPADTRTEALFREAKSRVASGGENRIKGLATLKELAASSDRYWGAQSGVIAGEELLKDNRLEEAEEIVTALIENGSTDNYWLARGYIVLADLYTAQENEHLAKLYLETLQSNYPGTETDIKEMIDNRLKNLNQ